MPNKNANIGRYAETKTAKACEAVNISCIRVDRRKGQLGEERSYDFKMTFPNGSKKTGEGKNVKGGFKRIRGWLDSADILFITEQNKPTLVVFKLDPTLGDIAGSPVVKYDSGE